MAAMFMRNKVLSWSSLFLSVQSYLNEPINKPDSDDASQPPFMKIVFAFVAVLTCYMDVFFPNTNPALRMAAKVATETPAASK